MYLDFKITAWDRVYIPEEIQEEVMQKLESGEVKTVEDALDYFEPRGVVFVDTIGFETMSLEENIGAATIEAITREGGDLIYKNGK